MGEPVRLPCRTTTKRCPTKLCPTSRACFRFGSHQCLFHPRKENEGLRAATPRVARRRGERQGVIGLEDTTGPPDAGRTRSARARRRASRGTAGTLSAGDAAGRSSGPIPEARAGPDAEPPGTTSAPRHGPVDQLPGVARSLVGRETETGRAKAWVGRHRRRDQPAPILLIDGAPGTGRSALALTIARELAAELPGPRLWARLGGERRRRQHPDEQLRRWLRDLGVAGGDLPEEPGELAERFLRQFAGTEAVVVVEEAATADEVTW